MINSMTVKNFLGEELTITLTEAEPSHGHILKKIDGLGAPTGVINISDLATDDGGSYNSARTEKRTIDMTLLLTFAPDIETSRQVLYRYFPIKKKVRLFFNTTNRNVYIDGYVEKCEPDIFSKEESVALSVVCDDPYFYETGGTNYTTFGSVNPLFEFEFENESLDENLIELSEYKLDRVRNIVYNGDIEAGIVIHIEAISGPVGNITIYNFITKELMKISSDRIEHMTGSKISAGDELIISTVHKNPYVELLRNGERTNMINAIDRKSDWFSLVKGNNIFGYSVDDETDDRIVFIIENDTIYAGL